MSKMVQLLDFILQQILRLDLMNVHVLGFEPVRVSPTRIEQALQICKKLQLLAKIKVISGN